MIRINLDCHFLFLPAILGFFSCNESPEYQVTSESPNYNIILVAGQSNTYQGIGYDPLLDTAANNILQLGRFDADLEVIPAREPLHHHQIAPGKIGFAMAFANQYVTRFSYTEDFLVIVPCGLGGTGFIDNKWNKGDELYNDAVFRVNYFLERNRNSKVIAILWHQGGKDVGNQLYENHLKKFITDIRRDIGAPSVPFILGGMVPYSTNGNEERNKIQEIVSSMEDRDMNIGYADPTFPFVITKEDNEFDIVHFDAKGQREMGKRYFQEYMNLIDQL